MKSALRKSIRDYQIAHGFHGMIGIIREHWTHPDLITYEGGKYNVSTGGCSENERIIEQMKKTSWWKFYREAEFRGGHFIFSQ